jgi:hypothetical protein
MHAALAALCAWNEGASALLDVSLRDVTANVLAERTTAGDSTVRLRTRSDERATWEVLCDREAVPVAEPRARVSAVRARPLGVDTTAVVAELCATC